MSPQGVLGYLIDFVRPPWGWSTGLRATPRTIGLTPNERQNPLFVFFNLRFIFRADGPGSTRPCTEKNFLTPDGNLTSAEWLVWSKEITRAEHPALRTYWIPRPGIISKLDIFFSLVAAKINVSEQAVLRRMNWVRGPLNAVRENIWVVSKAGM